MSKHTPGPWTINYAPNGLPYQIIASDQDDTKPGKVGTKITRWASISLPSSTEGMANARLIAASPDLLEACIEAIEAIKDGDAQSATNALNAAIAKATAA